MSQQLYHAMLHDLQLCKEKKLPCAQEIECCFQTCVKYWLQLKEKLTNHRFSSGEEEITFFKNIKPQFTSEIEYYNLLYHAVLFMPEPGTEDYKMFWQREAQRLPRFIEDNGAFMDYYNNRTDKDNFFFSAQAEEAAVTSIGTTAATANHAGRSYSDLVATTMALQKYNLYVLAKLKEV